MRLIVDNETPFVNTLVMREARETVEVKDGAQGTEDSEDRAPEAKIQRILSAAKAVFLKYGYRRVTMNDLAHAAGMSRPALYLVFAKKEDVFRGVVRELAREVSDQVNRGLGSISSPLEKLRFVCECWMIRPFDWVRQSPEAKEVFEGSHEFARDAVAEGMASFERDLASVIELFPKGALPKGASPKYAAHLLAGAIGGLKKTCESSSELREKTDALITMMFRT
jgi:AcrR family transcriptional regulator